METDHSDAIKRLRFVADKTNNQGSKFAHRCEAVASLLEVHDAGGLSLENFHGVDRFVNDVLEEFGFPPFEPNGV